MYIKDKKTEANCKKSTKQIIELCMVFSLLKMYNEHTRKNQL